jgi:hypothetical protein
MGKPAKEVIEGTVLHHHEHDVLDAGALRIGKRSGLDCTGSGYQSIESADGQESCTGRRSRQELPPGETPRALGAVL